MKRFLGILLSIVLALGLMQGMSLTAYAAEKSETISLISDNNITTATGTHFKVTCGYQWLDALGLTINKFGAMTVSSLDETVMTKVVWTYYNGSNKNTISVSRGTFNGNNTVTGINSTELTVSSSSPAGVKLNSITIYYYDGAHTHTWATAWSHDATYHWHACTGEDASDACLNETGAAKATHTYGDSGDARFTCTVCEYVDTTKQAEAEAADLAAAKTAAKADLDTLLAGKTEADYDAADWTTLTQAIAGGKTAIDNATTIDDVATAKSNAETAANAVKTTAEKAFDNAKTTATATVNGVNATDYIAADQQTVTEAKTAALNAINAATTEAEVTTALNTFNDAIANCTTQAAADQVVIQQVMSEVSARTGNDMTYNGSPIQLINTPTTALPAGYTMKYAVTTENTAPTDESLYTTSIPTKTEAGTYYVWYKVEGDANHEDSKPQMLEVTIAEMAEANEQFFTSMKVQQKNGKLKISWDKTDAKKVEVYATYCGNDFPAKPIKTTTGTYVTLKKIKGKKIDFSKSFKIYLKGYGSKDQEIGKTVSAYVAGKNNKKYTNVKSIKVNNTKVTLTKGNNTKIVATIKLENKKKKMFKKNKVAKFRFASTNPAVATVDKDGNVTGVGAGTCDVYVYAVNGLAKKVAVTVTE
ncbi:Ig-like domain-containing protein [Butyrivibrio sp. WCD3002]|uniref:Ig-like domain-containing protein n=1 Tax=Butyrivibrio sp. WCD3002 TaxID=1280676 RepID=UPI0018C9A43F